MPYYKPLFEKFREIGDQKASLRAAVNLLRLRRQLHKDVPGRTVSRTLLLATWNLREFGRNRKAGVRLDESLQYIGEIISHFDLIAIQEVDQDLHDLQRLMYILGDWWSYIVTDVTPGRAGNQERTAFVYDTRKVKFDHLAGEVVLPEGRRPTQQVSRSPFICAFRAGWRRISLCTVHFYYGSNNPNDPRRVREIDAVARLLAQRNTKRQTDADGEPSNVVLLGDFNVFHAQGDKTTEALESHAFIIPRQIRSIQRNKYYDQIAFHDPRKQLRPTARAGVFDFSKSVFRDADEQFYFKQIKKTIPKLFSKSTNKSRLYRNWRTFQLSDHSPLWIELTIDFTEGFLATAGGLVTRKKSRINPSLAGRTK